MEYITWLDRAAEKNPIWFIHTTLKYNGSLQEVLLQTAAALDASSKSSLELNDLILHPPRIIRACINYKTENPECEDRNILVQEATTLGLQIYQNLSKARSGIDSLKEKIHFRGYHELLTRELIQPHDFIDHLNPVRSKLSVDQLRSQVKKEDILFIALAQGGVAPGMDVFLRYCARSGSNNSVFYPIRFSRTKSGDTTPQVSTYEQKYLQKEGLGRCIVIFDDDVYTWDTMRGARSFLAKNVFSMPEKDIINQFQAELFVDNLR